MNGDYIRNHYSVPARVGQRVRYGATYLDGGPREGTIAGFDGQYLLVRLDGDDHSGRFHPTWEIEYLAAEATS